MNHAPAAPHYVVEPRRSPFDALSFSRHRHDKVTTYGPVSVKCGDGNLIDAFIVATSVSHSFDICLHSFQTSVITKVVCFAMTAGGVDSRHRLCMLKTPRAPAVVLPCPAVAIVNNDVTCTLELRVS